MVVPSLAFSVAQFAVVLTGFKRFKGGMFASDNGCETGLLKASCHRKEREEKKKREAKGGPLPSL